MLSKSAARSFFLAGTALCSVAFILLTADTMSQIPQRAHVDKMDAAVVRGHDIWNDNNCMGCHTLLGEGAYYAPELTRVVERRGESWLKMFLKDPQAMYPGRRKMVQYNFSNEEIDDLLAFFSWIEKVDTNGFPAKPPLAAAAQGPGHAQAANAAQEGRPAVFDQVCVACHALAGKGGNVGPALDGVATRFDAKHLDDWLADPQKLKPGTAMPKLPLTDAQRQELVQFLTRQK
jgi:nitric oxide reductase subunit C